MPAFADWPLVHSRPAVRLSLIDPSTGTANPRVLLADTGAGPKNASFDLLLDEDDCFFLCTEVGEFTRLSGAYSGEFRVYFLDVVIEDLGISLSIKAVGVSNAPPGFDGIAGFRFLSRFTFGNFGDTDRFGLEA